MPDPRLQTKPARSKRYAITIPASGTTTGATIRSLLVTAGWVASDGQISGVKILAFKADASDRAAFDVADAATAAEFTRVKEAVKLATEWVGPGADDADRAVRAAANATIAAVAVVSLD